LFNPLANPHKLTLCHNILTGFYEIECEHYGGHVRLVLGKARTAAEFLDFNQVRFFDYDSNLVTGTAFDDFQKAAADVGFEI